MTELDRRLADRQDDIERIRAERMRRECEWRADERGSDCPKTLIRILVIDRRDSVMMMMMNQGSSSSFPFWGRSWLSAWVLLGCGGIETARA